MTRLRLQQVYKDKDVCLIRAFTHTFFLGIHKKGVLVFLFAVYIQKMELSFHPLNFLEANDKQQTDNDDRRHQRATAETRA